MPTSMGGSVEEIEIINLSEQINRNQQGKIEDELPDVYGWKMIQNLFIILQSQS